MQTIYSGWFFRFLLAGFFINILVSALLRFPFKIRHIPFLITHLGLLTIITGLIVKSFFGLQGIMIVPAGSEKAIAYIPEQKEVVLEIKDKGTFRFLLDQDFLGKWTLNPKKEPFFEDEKGNSWPSLRILGSHPHSQLVIDNFFKGDFLDIEGLRPFPAFKWTPGVDLPISGKIRMPNGEVFTVIAVKTKNAEDAINALTIKPSLLFVQDEAHTVHIVGIDQFREVQKYFLSPRVEEGQLLAYDEGFSGYGVQVPFPSHAMTLVSSRDLSLPLRAFDGSKELCALFMKTLEEEGHFLYRGLTPLPHAVADAIAKSSLFENSKELIKGLSIVSLIVSDVLDKDSKTLSEAFKKRNLPFLRRFLPMDEQDDALLLANLLEMAMCLGSEDALDSLYASQSTLSIPEKAKLISLLLRIYDISIQEEKPYMLETRLKLNWKTEKLVNPEDLKPLFLLEITYDDKKEKAIAGLDLEGRGFTGSCLEGQGKLYLSPLTYQIPYSIRMHDAREIRYPGSSQAEEYECSFTLTDRKTKESALKHIGMNRVFESDDGYRFFLSHIIPSDESAPQEVRLALNYDPSKRLFIYAGSILVALGIVLLYFFAMKKD